MTPETKITEPTPDVRPLDPNIIEMVDERKKRYLAHIKDQTKRGQEHKTLIDYLRSKTIEIKGRDEQAHIAHLVGIDKTCKYLAGEQYGSWDADGNYTPYVRLPNEVAYCVPTIIGHFRQALMMILKTDLAYVRKSYDETNPSHVALNDMCEKVAVADYRRLMNNTARIDEGINALTAGESHRLLIWGIHDNPKMIDKPDYEEAGWEIPESKVCNSCQMANPADATQCSECESDWLKTIPGSTEQKQIFKGTKKVPVGQNLLHIPHMAAVKSDLAAPDISSATYVIETDYLANKEVAQWLYQCLIEDSDGRSSRATRLQRELRSATTVVTQQGRSWVSRGESEVDYAGQHGGKPIERNHVWLEVSEYGYKSFPQDEKLPDGNHCDTCEINYDSAEMKCAKCGGDLEEGSVIKANQLMGEALPSGVKYCLVGKTCVSGGKGNKKIQWKKLLYEKRPGSSRGMGIQSYIPIQDVENDVLNFELDIVMTSVPFRAAVARYVDKMPKAGEWLKLNNMPPGGIEHAVTQFGAQTPSGVIGAMSERLESAGQFIHGTQTVIGRTGDPSQKALGTAHGVAAVVEQQNGRFVTPTTQRVACDEELLDSILINIQTHSSEEQKQELKRRFGETADDFFNANFEHIGYWDVVSGSDKPRSDALTGALMSEFGNLAASMMEKMPNVPWVGEFLSTLGDLIGIPFKMVPGGSDRHEAEKRLRKLAAIERDIQKRNPALLQDAQAGAEKMFELLEEFIGPLSIEKAMEEAKKHGDPTGINGAIPFLYMQDHQAMSEVIKEDYFSDDAQMFSPARKAVMIRMYAVHAEAFVAAEGLKADFKSGLLQKMSPPDPNANKQPSQGLAKVVESIAFKDVAGRFPTVAKQIVEGAGMDSRGMYPDEGQTPAPSGEGGDGVPHPEEHLRAIDHKLVDHHLGQQADDEALKRRLLEDSHKAELDVATHEAKAAATARYSAFKPEGGGGGAKE